MRKSTEQTPQTAEKQSPKSRSRKTAQAIAFAVLTVIGAEQATSPKIAQAGLAHAQEETAKETQRVQERNKLVVKKNDTLLTINNIMKALIPINPQSTQAKKLLSQLYQMQNDFIIVCTALGKFYDGDKETISGIDEVFKMANFTPDKNAPNVYVCDANGCKL